MKYLIMIILLPLMLTGTTCKENDVNPEKQWGYELDEPVVERPVEPGGAPVVPEPMTLALVGFGVIVGFKFSGK